MRKFLNKLRFKFLFYIISKFGYIEEEYVKSLLYIIIIKSNHKYRVIENKKLDNIKSECYNITSEYESEAKKNQIDSFYYGQAVLAKTILEKLS